MAPSLPRLAWGRSSTLNLLHPLFSAQISCESVFVPETHGPAENEAVCACPPRRILKLSFLHVGTVNNVGFVEILEHVNAWAKLTFVIQSEKHCTSLADVCISLH